MLLALACDIVDPGLNLLNCSLSPLIYRVLVCHAIPTSALSISYVAGGTAGYLLRVVHPPVRFSIYTPCWKLLYHLLDFLQAIWRSFKSFNYCIDGPLLPSFYLSFWRHCGQSRNCCFPRIFCRGVLRINFLGLFCGISRGWRGQTFSMRWV